MNDVQKTEAKETELNLKKDFRHMSFSEIVDEPDSLKLARIVFFQREQNRSLKKISDNILWFFYLSLIYLFGSIVVVFILNM